MRVAYLARLATVAAILSVAVNGAWACQCGVGFREKNSWENARRAEQGETAIFEGTPTKFELRWDLLDAAEGELVAADAFSTTSMRRMPHMVVSFHVEKSYKGNLGADVQLHTGLGGGDCGATYVPGLHYLVYAGGPSLDQLDVSMCSPGGWLESAAIATNLRYLRKEQPTPQDLAPIKRWSEEGFAEQEETRKRSYEDWRRRFDSATGKVCGKLVHDDAKEGGEGSIAFLSTIGYSPNAPPYAERKDDGSFCSQNLGPGKYYLFFVQQDGASALYYPGVTNVAKATPIEVRAGQTQNGIVFHVSKQPSYSVRGFVYADDRSAFDSNLLETSIALVRSDGDRRVWYDAKAKFRLLPKALYFKVDNVVPGRYFAFVQGRAGWMSRKVVVDVSTHSKFITVDLVRKK